MGTFEIGIGGPSGGARNAEQLASAGLLAEGAGFSWFGIGEHVLFQNPTSSSLINLSYLAGVTSRIRLLSAIALVPLYPAALLAKMTASLAVVSGGRFEMGVGVGGEYPAEFEACGVDVRTRGARTDECLDIVRRLWTGEEVTHSGRFWQFAGRLQPAPPVPPRIWVAGRSPAAVHRAVRTGDVYMPYLVRERRLVRQLAEIAAGERAVPVVPYVFVHVDEDSARARADAASWVGHLYRQDAEAFHDLVIAGTAQECIDRIGRMRDLGCAGVHITPVCPAEQWSDRCAMLGDELLPTFLNTEARGSSVSGASV